MLHSLDMPSALGDDPTFANSQQLLPSPSNAAAASIASKRSSVEKASRRSADSIPTSYRPDDLLHFAPKTNGVVLHNNSNGVGPSSRSPPANGELVEGQSPQKESEARMNWHPHNNSSLPSNSVESKSIQAPSEHTPHRLATRDDGFFAENGIAEEGYFSTHVKLAPPNGSVFSGTEDTEDSKDASGSSDNAYPADGDRIHAVPRPSDSSVHDASARPGQRISSPPAFQNNSASNLTTPQPGRLQHRHTLEVPAVPRISTSRLSRETTRTADEAITTGRFSPAPNTPTRRRGSMSLVRRVTRSAQSDLHLDEVPGPEDAERWAEMIRQKRASKRKRKDDEDDEKVVMGTKVDQGHVNYITAYNMLTGIRFTVSRTNAKLDRELTDADFDARHKFSFDITGNELTPSAKYDFKFKDYAPWVFRHLRAIFRLDPADYLMSLTSKYILSELGSPGKSGSFFYFSRDYKYIIKTIHHAEHKVLRRILRDYYHHVKDNPNTLLSQFYGLHRVKIPYGRKIHFVVMNNLFPPHRDIHQTFDLKGSTIGRDFKEDELDKNPRATLKDLNWLRRGMHLELGPTKKHAFIDQMQKDVALLRRLKIMDYSMLIGIHDLARGNEDKLRDKTLQVFQPGGEAEGSTSQTTSVALMRTPSKLETARKVKELRHTLKHERPVPVGQTMTKMPEEMTEDERRNFYFYSNDGGFRATHEDDTPGEQIYYLGIIDCLTHYGLIKRVEHFIKGLGNTESQISAIPPERYGERFVQFMRGVTKSRELADTEAAQAEQDPARESLALPIEDAGGAGPSEQREPRSRPVSTALSVAESITTKSKTDKVMEKAERVAERTIKHGATEDHVPERQLGTVKSPPTEANDPGGAYTLPVVEEAAENGSTGGRSARSQEASPVPAARGVFETKHNSRSLEGPPMEHDHDHDHDHPPPPTPPKDSFRTSSQAGELRDGMMRRYTGAGKDYRPPTPPKDEKYLAKPVGKEALPV